MHLTLFKDKTLDNLLQGNETEAWDAFRLVSDKVLVNIRAEKYRALTEMLPEYYKIGCNIALNVHLHFHLNFVCDKCGIVSD